MAARENQGYLIAVILLVLLSLLLALLFFLNWMRANDLADAKLQAEQKGNSEGALREAYEKKSEILMSLIGGLGKSVAEVETSRQMIDRTIDRLQGSDRDAVVKVKNDIDLIMTEYQKDMNLFLGARDENREDTWRSLNKNFNDALARNYNELETERNTRARVEREAQTEIAAKQKEVEEKTELLMAAQRDLSVKTEEFINYKTEQDNKFEEFQSRYTSLERDSRNKQSDLSNTIRSKAEEIVKIESEKTILKTKVDRYERENFDIADGKVIRVGAKSVFIDVGSKDGLKTTQTFSIFDARATSFETKAPKASIEVIKVWDHQAEARVTFENPLDPILADDQILNPVWDPGYNVPIALAGVFDLDGDGIDDTHRLLQMIRQNGGNVVAYHDAEGKVNGEIDPATRYLVVGNSPISGKHDNAELVSRGMREILNQGKANQIQEIDVRKLLNWMGRHSLPSVERLDSQIGNQYRSRDSSVR